jgi:hypothetical protein
MPFLFALSQAGRAGSVDGHEPLGGVAEHVAVLVLRQVHKYAVLVVGPTEEASRFILRDACNSSDIIWFGLR